MTDNELYNIIMNDDETTKCLENNNYKRLFKYIMTAYDVPMSQVANLLINAGIEPFNEGKIFDGAFEGDKTLTSFDFSNITTIGRMAFKGSGLTSANLRNVKKVEIGAFFGSDLSEVYFSSGAELETASFSRCKFTELYIPDKVIVNDLTFAGCDNLETIVLDGSNIFIDFTAFENCRHINNIFITSDNVDSLKALINSSNETELTINVIPVSSVPYDENYIKELVSKYKDMPIENVTVKEVKG